MNFKPRVFLQPTKHIGRQIVPEMPANLLNYRGPYKSRKQRRWRQANPAYTVSDGTFYVFRENTVICHDNDATWVAEFFRQQGFDVL